MIVATVSSFRTAERRVAHVLVLIFFWIVPVRPVLFREHLVWPGVALRLGHRVFLVLAVREVGRALEPVEPLELFVCGRHGLITPGRSDRSILAFVGQPLSDF